MGHLNNIEFRQRFQSIEIINRVRSGGLAGDNLYLMPLLCNSMAGPHNDNVMRLAGHETLVMGIDNG